jgi:hypothetical protein
MVKINIGIHRYFSYMHTKINRKMVFQKRKQKIYRFGITLLITTNFVKTIFI